MALWRYVLTAWICSVLLVASTAFSAAPARDAEKCAEAWLPFVERVGMPWIALCGCLFVMGCGVILFITRLSPELAKMAALQSVTNERLVAAKESTMLLAVEVRNPTPVHGTPIPVIVDKGVK